VVPPGPKFFNYKAGDIFNRSVAATYQKRAAAVTLWLGCFSGHCDFAGLVFTAPGIVIDRVGIWYEGERDNKMSMLMVGSMALDTVKTPFGDKKDILGGSATYASVSASFYTEVRLVAVVGQDFPAEHVNFLQSRKIDTRGLQVADGATFRWSGYYEYDMNQAHTMDTRLNVLADFNPELPEAFRD
jgi:hypothetical protein